MAKVIRLSGQRPGGWAKDRWAWIGAVMAASDLNPTAKLVAVSLAQGFANHDTAECRPGLPALMRSIAASRRAVLRALADLRAAGWVDERGGNAPGRAAGYVFRWPEQVPNMTPEQVPDMTPENAQQVPDMTPEQVPDLARTGARFGTPPRPPYMEQPQMNHKTPPATVVHPRAALRPPKRPNIVTKIVAPGSAAHEAWDSWLVARGFAVLDQIGQAVEGGGWIMPTTTAPGEGDQIAYRIALGWAGWLRTR